ncbi:MotA/TolQ/ExbB proton channel family protein [endosymbiont of Ridgeia piscesae]|jgi:biopolymer transport protein ExbB/TolQ|uniref:Outer membrane transport energization protein ExbB n=1 Tax=endosymbiont of Ridgeia piscesae TaxID=54398 RepID=A0A0T5Z9A9_9GAMM|nr:MotA/TolQ/ExbB proton channel family protein [endosymbiont of Ridgeia piscesae]KRT54534.1 outer membrane transport energization protein ExbB [endosymbiont of Ridgeia piscesae]KRT59474.1 outer membrane transport energization protein ExbB [endosymbiont of Ridgeia piscesae]
MYPILLIFAAGLAIAIERYLYLVNARLRNNRFWTRMLPQLNQGDFKQALESAADSSTALGRIMVYGLDRVRSARRRSDLEMAMEEGLMEEIPRFEKRTHYLSALANIATLLGLLGTIIGLINAFTAVSAADPAEKADLLSASISVAMNTTAFGLMAAIPLLLVYTLLQSRTTQIVDSLEMASVKFLNIVTERAGSAR